MAEDAAAKAHEARRGLKGELAAVVDDLEHSKASGVAKLVFHIAERLIILTGVAYAERKAPAVAKTGLFCLKLVLSSVFVWWIVTPFRRSALRASHALKAKIDAHPALQRLSTGLYVVAVVILSLLVTRMLNYFLNYLSPPAG